MRHHLLAFRHLVAFFFLASTAFGQANYVPVGIPQFSKTIPVPNGFVDPLSGQLHIEIPIASVPLRDGDTQVVKLVYDSTWYSYDGNYNALEPQGPGWTVFNNSSKLLWLGYKQSKRKPGAVWTTGSR